MGRVRERIDVAQTALATLRALPLGEVTTDIVRDAAIQTAHTYNESLAQAIFSRLPSHVSVMEGWLHALEERTKAGELS